MEREPVTVACGCGVVRNPDEDPELIEGWRADGGKGYTELDPPRRLGAATGMIRVRYLRACRRCGAVYLPRC